MRKIVLLILLCFMRSMIFAEMVEVSVDAIEIKHNQENNVGMNWNEGFNFLEGLQSNAEFANFSGGIAPSMLSIGTMKRTEAIGGRLMALMKDNTARILANPKLATEAGSQASFLVGGEIPIPVASAQGMSLEWKTYGVNLQIKPDIVQPKKKGDKKQIKAMIQVSVSDLDFANSVRLQGFDVPGMLNRSANSMVIVDDGGTVVIAGLKQTRKETTVQKVPILGYIPLAGGLFRGTAQRDIKTSMVVFVTFKILKKK